jgi:hypothetical protein
MRHLVVSSLLIPLIACYGEPGEDGLNASPNLSVVEETDPAQAAVVTGDDSDPDDSNGDGIDDDMQSYGPGYESDGSPYWVIFQSGAWPAYTDNMGLVGYGGGAYGTVDNDWQNSWAPLVDYMVDGVVIGKAFRNIRDGKYEVNCVDLGGPDREPFEPYQGEGWCYPEEGITGSDDTEWLTTHIDGEDCPGGGRESTHYLFWVEEGVIKKLTDGIAPPDPHCID